MYIHKYISMKGVEANDKKKNDKLLKYKSLKSNYIYFLNFFTKKTLTKK